MRSDDGQQRGVDPDRGDFGRSLDSQHRAVNVLEPDGAGVGLAGRELVGYLVCSSSGGAPSTPEPWFRMALRSLVRTAAAGGRWEDAAVLLGACRRDMPVHLQDPAVYGPIEERCRDALGRARFDRLVERGQAMDHDRLMRLAGADDRDPSSAETRSPAT